MVSSTQLYPEFHPWRKTKWQTKGLQFIGCASIGKKKKKKKKKRKEKKKKGKTIDIEGG